MRQSAPKSKSLALAIGLNLLLPGAGYIYYGKWIIGFLGGALVLAIVASNSTQNAFMVWAMVSAVMALDMLMLHSRNKRKLQEGQSVKCISCAEFIKHDAKKCRFCGEEVGVKP